MTTVQSADAPVFEAVILLYLACSKLPDGDLGEAEARRILELTRQHTAGLADSYAPSVIADVAAGLAAASDGAERLGKVVAAAELVASSLPATEKQEIVDDLLKIAGADGAVSSQELDFVDAVARTFGLEPPRKG